MPRWVHRIWAFVRGYYWLPCPRCGRMFGGHEGRGCIPSDRPGIGKTTCCPPYEYRGEAAPGPRCLSPLLGPGETCRVSVVLRVRVQGEDA